MSFFFCVVYYNELVVGKEEHCFMLFIYIAYKLRFCLQSNICLEMHPKKVYLFFAILYSIACFTSFLMSCYPPLFLYVILI